MPVLPKYQPQVKAQLKRTPAFQMKSANVDIDTTKLEQGLNNVVKAAETIQMDIDNAKFNEMHTDYIQKQERKFRSVETVDGKPDSEPIGIFNKPQFKGINAIDLPKTVQQGFDELVDETTQKAGVSPSMAAYFKRKMTEQYGGRLMAEANQVAGKEIERGKISAASGLVDAERAQWMKNGVDHPEYFSGLDKITAMTRELGVLNHQDLRTASVNADKKKREMVQESLVNVANADPDKARERLNDKRFSPYLNETDKAKLEGVIIKSEDRFVNKSSETLYRSVILPGYENGTITDPKLVTNTQEFKYISAKNPTAAMQIINNVKRHNEDTSVDAVTGYIAATRNAGKKITDYRQLPADLWDNLVTYAPSKADQLMNRFDTEKEMRAARAAANRANRNDLARFVFEANLNPSEIKPEFIIAAVRDGKIPPATGTHLLDIYAKGANFQGEVTKNFQYMDSEIDNLLKDETPSKRKQIKNDIRRTMLDLAPSLVDKPQDFTREKALELVQELHRQVTKVGWFGREVSGLYLEGYENGKTSENEKGVVNMLMNRYGVSEADARRRARLLKSKGVNPRVFEHHKKGRF